MTTPRALEPAIRVQGTEKSFKDLQVPAAATSAEDTA